MPCVLSREWQEVWAGCSPAIVRRGRCYHGVPMAAPLPACTRHPLVTHCRLVVIVLLSSNRPRQAHIDTYHRYTC